MAFGRKAVARTRTDLSCAGAAQDLPVRGTPNDISQATRSGPGGPSVHSAADACRSSHGRSIVVAYKAWTAPSVTVSRPRR